MSDNKWGSLPYVDLVGKLTDVGPILASGGGGWGLGGYGFFSNPSRNRLVLEDDGLLHVYDQWSINGDIRDNGYGMRIRDYYAPPAQALDEDAWHFIESSQISPTNTPYGLTCTKLDQHHLWLTMVDWWMGNTSFAGYYTRITVDARSGLAVHMNMPGSPETDRDTTGYGYPVVVNGQRYLVFRGGQASPYGIGDNGYGYLKVDATGLTIGGVFVVTGSFNDYIGATSGYTVDLISAWANGSAIEFAIWDEYVPGLMHILRIDNPSALEMWTVAGTIQVTPGSTIDSIRMMDDGYLCMVLSVEGNKHLVWWKDNVLEEEYLDLKTSEDDANFYTGSIFGGPTVGALTLYAGGRKNARGVFGFRYVESNNLSHLHLGIKIANLSPRHTTKTLYHTVITSAVGFGGSGGDGYALVSPSILNTKGVWYFLFARVVNGVYTDCFVRANAQSNAIWYGE